MPYPDDRERFDQLAYDLFKNAPYLGGAERMCRARELISLAGSLAGQASTRRDAATISAYLQCIVSRVIDMAAAIEERDQFHSHGFAPAPS